MESALYGIYALVVFVSEILLVRCAHSFDFWYVNNSCVNTVRQHFPWSILYKEICIHTEITAFAELSTTPYAKRWARSGGLHAPAWEGDCKERNVQSMAQDVMDQKKKQKKTKKSTIKCVSWSRSRRCCLLNRIVMFRTSEPYTLEDYCLLFIIDRSQSINYFFWDFDFYRFPISIDNNQRIKSIISHNFWYRFLSINYA